MKTTGSATKKRYEAFQDFVGNEKCKVEVFDRPPLPAHVRAYFVEEVARNKERVRRGSFYKKHSKQRFGEGRK